MSSYWLVRVLSTSQNRVSVLLARRNILTFALAQQKSAYPAHTQELDDDEDDKPLVRPDGSTVSEDEDEEEKHPVLLASKEKR